MPPFFFFFFLRTEKTFLKEVGRVQSILYKMVIEFNVSCSSFFSNFSVKETGILRDSSLCFTKLLCFWIVCIFFFFLVSLQSLDFLEKRKVFNKSIMKAQMDVKFFLMKI